MIIQKPSSIISCMLATALTFLPFNYILGSKFAWFSCVSMAIPALGYQCSLFYAILSICTKAVLIGSCSSLFLLHRIPLLLATYAMKYFNIQLYVGLPSAAMLLFCLHPVGVQVFYYSWYWLIPIGIYLFVTDTILSRALAASFIAHAAGSVIWLYAGTIPAQTWTALMPIVVIERLLIAAGMVGCVYLFAWIDDLCTRCCRQESV